MTVELSVIIACWNAEDTIGIQLDALSRQVSDVPWEVIVCDNGSTDATLEVVERYRTALPSLRVIHAADVPGPSFARNAGAAASSATWLAFVDADDEVSADWLAEMLAGLRAHDFVAGRFEGARLNKASTIRARELSQQDGLQRSSFGPGLPHAGAGNMGIRREIFDQVGGFDTSLRNLQDTDFSWRVQLAGHDLVFVPQVEMHVRLRASLRQMWRQGMLYGIASAQLEDRYGTPEAGPAVEAGSGRGPAGPGGALRALLGLAADLVRRRSPGKLIWTLGWHVGHRRGPATSR